MSEQVVSKSTYFKVFAILLILTATTTGIAFIDLGPLNTIMAILIAVIKASLVVLFFMHVKYSKKLTKLVVAAGFFWLAIMVGLTLSDYFSRTWLWPR